MKKPMNKQKIRIFAAFLACVLLLSGCAQQSVNPEDCQVEVSHEKLRVPSLGWELSLPAPWFVVTAQQLDEIVADPEKINEYIDEDGVVLHPLQETYRAESVMLMNGKTFEMIEVFAKHDDVTEDMGVFVDEVVWPKMETQSDEISLVEELKLGELDGFGIFYIPKDTELYRKKYFVHAKETYLEITTTGYSDHAIIPQIVEGKISAPSSAS